MRTNTNTCTNVSMYAYTYMHTYIFVWLVSCPHMDVDKVYKWNWEIGSIYVHINIYQYISFKKMKLFSYLIVRCLQGLIEPQRLLRLLTLFLLINSGPCFLYMAQLQFSPFYSSQKWYGTVLSTI